MLTDLFSDGDKLFHSLNSLSVYAYFTQSNSSVRGNKFVSGIDFKITHMAHVIFYFKVGLFVVYYG